MNQIKFRTVALLAIAFKFISLITLTSDAVAQIPNNEKLENLGVFTFDAR